MPTATTNVGLFHCVKDKDELKLVFLKFFVLATIMFFGIVLFRILMHQQAYYKTTVVMYNAFKNLPNLQEL